MSLQLFGLQDTAEEAEVLFTHHFQSAVSKVLSHDMKSTRLSRTSEQGNIKQSFQQHQVFEII